jgi:hypothetical protein
MLLRSCEVLHHLVACLPCSQANLPFTNHYEAALDAYLKNSEEQRRKVKERNKTAAVHVYHVEDYGLTPEQIRQEFADYIKAYC